MIMRVALSDALFFAQINKCNCSTNGDEQERYEHVRKSTLKMFAYGHDFGNSETCGVLMGHSYHQNRQIPSVFAFGTWREVETMAASAGKSVREYVQFGHYVGGVVKGECN